MACARRPVRPGLRAVLGRSMQYCYYRGHYAGPPAHAIARPPTIQHPNHTNPASTTRTTTTTTHQSCAVTLGARSLERSRTHRSGRRPRRGWRCSRPPAGRRRPRGWRRCSRGSRQRCGAGTGMGEGGTSGGSVEYVLSRWALSGCYLPTQLFDQPAPSALRHCSRRPALSCPIFPCPWRPPASPATSPRAPSAALSPTVPQPSSLIPTHAYTHTSVRFPSAPTSFPFTNIKTHTNNRRPLPPTLPLTAAPCVPGRPAAGRAAAARRPRREPGRPAGTPSAARQSGEEGSGQEQRDKLD